MDLTTTKSQLLAEIEKNWQTLHAALSSLADLQKSYRAYLPDEPGQGDGPPALQVIYGNTAGHFAEHLAWIEALAGSNSVGN